MALINPYNFVPLSGKPKRSEYPGLDKFKNGAYSGLLKCELEVVSPLISVDHQTVQKHRCNNKALDKYTFIKDTQGVPIIPGSSLKGMIRSVYEAITNSCLHFAATKGTVKKGRNKSIDYEYSELSEFSHEKCNNTNNLCPACRLFGVSLDEELHCQGRISFSDARIVKGGLEVRTCILKDLMAPNPYHFVVYGKDGLPGKEIAGRKFYYHHGEQPSFSIVEKKAGKFSKAIAEYAPKGSKFAFQVCIEGLAIEEVKHVIKAMELEDGLGHKIGLGKPIGLGSCKINIFRDRSVLSNCQDRYKSLRISDENKWQYDESHSNVVLPAELKEILRLDKYKDGEIGYPSFNDYQNAYKTARINGKGFFQIRQAPQRGKTNAPKSENLAEKATVYSTGVVQEFGLGNSKSYGYITSTKPGGEKVFVHKNDLRKGVNTLKKGQEVLFQKVTSPKGPKARDVHFPTQENGAKLSDKKG
jgi:cold shock CspA family protein